MAAPAYVLISATDTQSGAYISSALGAAFNTNVESAFAGLAPFKVEDAGLSTTVTAAGQSWVAARAAIPAAGGINSYAMLTDAGSVSRNPGSEVAGSSLWYTNAGGITKVTQPSGTWRLMGQLKNTETAAPDRVSLWLRIS